MSHGPAMTHVNPKDVTNYDILLMPSFNQDFLPDTDNYMIDPLEIQSVFEEDAEKDTYFQNSHQHENKIKHSDDKDHEKSVSKYSHHDDDNKKLLQLASETHPGNNRFCIDIMRYRNDYLFAQISGNFKKCHQIAATIVHTICHESVPPGRFLELIPTKVYCLQTNKTKDSNNNTVKERQETQIPNHEGFQGWWLDLGNDCTVIQRVKYALENPPKSSISKYYEHRPIRRLASPSSDVEATCNTAGNKDVNPIQIHDDNFCFDNHVAESSQDLTLVDFYSDIITPLPTKKQEVNHHHHNPLAISHLPKRETQGSALDNFEEDDVGHPNGQDCSDVNSSQSDPLFIYVRRRGFDTSYDKECEGVNLSDKRFCMSEPLRQTVNNVFRNIFSEVDVPNGNCNTGPQSEISYKRTKLVHSSSPIRVITINEHERELSRFDVLCMEIPNCDILRTNHIGNNRIRTIMQMNHKKFNGPNTSLQDKQLIVEDIVRQVVNSKKGDGKFIVDARVETGDKKWREIDDTKACSIVSLFMEKCRLDDSIMKLPAPSDRSVPITSTSLTEEARSSITNNNDMINNTNHNHIDLLKELHSAAVTSLKLRGRKRVIESNRCLIPKIYTQKSVNESEYTSEISSVTASEIKTDIKMKRV